MSNQEVLTHFKKSLLAVVLGNLLYFGLLYPILPEILRHQPHRIDWGLLLDFLVCLGIFGLIEWWVRRRQPARAEQS